MSPDAKWPTTVVHLMSFAIFHDFRPILDCLLSERGDYPETPSPRAPAPKRTGSRASIGVFRAAQLVLMEVPAESIVTDRGLLCYRCQGSGIKCGVLTGLTGLGSSACFCTQLSVQAS